MWWLVLSALLVSVAVGEQYAVLAAGSNGFWNYRHQADICHAYHVLINHGFNASNIILFSYNDVPTDSMNPFHGTLFNHPGNNSVNVNAGCKKDYTGAAVNASNFLAVITGNATAVQGGNGRVLKSGPDDDVFINFVDHGAPGLVAFPDTYLYADQLNESLTYMYTHKMYKNLVFYLEACESGSMFDGILSKDIHIYATTAANPNESSWGTYCDRSCVINGTYLNTCLGDLYSVNWMEDSDVANFTVETLSQQFAKVKNLTFQSHVMEYGALSISSNTLNKFQGPKTAKKLTVESVASEHWDSYDVKLKTLFSIYMSNQTEENSQAVINELRYREDTQNTFEIIGQLLDPTGEENLLTSFAPVSDFSCLRGSVATYEMQCGRLEDYGLQYVQVLVNACEGGHSLAQMDGVFSEACSSVRADRSRADLPTSLEV